MKTLLLFVLLSVPAFAQGFEVYMLNNSATVKVYQANVSIKSWFPADPEVYQLSGFGLPAPHVETDYSLIAPTWPLARINANFCVWGNCRKTSVKCSAPFNPSATNHAYLLVKTDAQGRDYCHVLWDGAAFWDEALK